MGRAVLSSIVIFISSMPCLGQVAGNALQFDGVNDLVRIPDSSSLDLSTAATIEFWCRPYYPTPPSRDFQRIINKGDGANGHTDRAYEIAILQPFHSNGPGFDCAFFIGSSTYTSTIVPYSWQSGTWVHFAATFSLAVGEVRTYVNGDLAVVSATTAGGQPIDQPIRNSTYPLNIGAFQEPGLLFAGQLDEVRIWNIARSACEIEANYDRQVDPSTPGLVGYWRFDESVGIQTVTDSSPAGNNGTLGNTSGAASDDPTRVGSTAPISVATTDCNLNGISDPCDISSGASQDCNNNGVPDECDSQPIYLLVASVQLPGGPILAYRIQGTGPAEALPSITGGGISSPTGITFNRQGELFVSNLGNASISRFAIDADGVATPHAPITGNNLSEPTDLIFGSSGELFVANRANGSIPRFVFDGNGAPIPSTPISTGAIGSHGVALSRAGELFYTNSDTNILRFLIDPGTGLATPNGSFPIPGHATLRYMEFDSQDELFVPDDFAHKVWRYRLIQGSPVANGSISVTSALGAVVSPSRELFVSSGAGGIYRFRLDQSGQAISNGVIPTPGLNSLAIRIMSINDCNANGVPDSCDIASGFSQDCNANGIPDSCDIASGAADCNNNGEPDECEVQTLASASAIQFDGVDDHVAIPGFGVIAPTSEITIEFWQKAEAGGEHPVFGLLDGSTTNRISAFVPWVNGAVYWQFGNRATNGQLSYTPAASILGTWQHFALVASQAGNYMQILHNGILEASRSGMTPFVQSSLAFSIGSFREDSTLAPFAGSIDEFRVWSIARSQAQIQSTLHKQLSGNEPNLLAYYRFDEGTGLTAVNLAAGSAASNGTLTNGPAWVASGAPIFVPNPANDCNANSIPDSCDIAAGAADCNNNSVPDSCDIAAGAPDCNGDSIPDVCQSGLAPVINSSPQSLSVCTGSPASLSVGVTGPGSYAYQWRKNGAPIVGATSNPLVIPTTGPGDTGSYDVIVTTSCGQAISNPAMLTITPNIPAAHYALGTLCPPTAIPNAGIIGFTDDGPIAGSCFGQRSFRLFAGQETVATGKVTRVRPGCIIQAFGPTLCTPESVLVDVHGRWQGICSLPNLLIVGACNTIYFINPANGAICEQFPDPTFAHIGQMAIDSLGRLFVGSIDGDSLNVIDMGAVDPFYTAPGKSLRAVAVDAVDTVYVTGAMDGVMRKIGPDGTVLSPAFASGLQGAISQAIAPHGIFHGNLFVACGDRVMEVDLQTGASSTFLSCRAARGIAFDPEGYMHISIPSENKVLKIGPSLPGDMDGSGTVTIDDAAGFAAALLQLPNAPLPMITADMNGDGCADGRDVQLFVNVAMGG